MKTKILVFVSAIAMFGAAFAWSQVNEFLRVNVPFPFTVGAKELPAGEYDFARRPLNNAITVTSAKGGPSANCVIKARIWEGIHTTPTDSHVVFDQIGNKYVFSELWIPGADGFVFNITQGEHVYKVINVH
jgi:hypothetical protein